MNVYDFEALGGKLAVASKAIYDAVLEGAGWLRPLSHQTFQEIVSMWRFVACKATIIHSDGEEVEFNLDICSLRTFAKRARAAMADDRHFVIELADDSKKIVIEEDDHRIDALYSIATEYEEEK